MIDVGYIRELLNQVPHPPDEPIPAGARDSDCDGFEQLVRAYLCPLICENGSNVQMDLVLAQAAFMASGRTEPT